MLPSTKFSQNVVAWLLFSYCSIETNRKKFKGTQRTTIKKFSNERKAFIRSANVVLSPCSEGEGGGKSSEPKEKRTTMRTRLVSVTEACFCERNLLVTGNCLSNRIFLLRKLDFVTDNFSQTEFCCL